MSALENLKIKAAWYDPRIKDVQNNPMFGTLNIDELETFQTIDISKLKLSKSKSDTKKIPILYGVGFKTITLLDVIKTKSLSNLTDFQVVTYVCNDIILNIHYKKTDKVKKISFSYPFVWGPFRNQESKETPRFKINKTTDIDNEVKLHIGQIRYGSYGMLEEKTTQAEFFQIESKTGKNLEDMMEFLKSTNHFVRLCVGRIIFPKDIQGNIDKVRSFDYYPYWLIQYHQSSKLKNPDLITDPIIKYQELEIDFEKIIKKWIKMWFETKEIMFDFFNIEETSMSLNTMFTEYCSVLQRFYDSLENKRNLFNKIINWSLNFCPSNTEAKIRKDGFVKKIVNTRNYNTHGNDVNENYLIQDGYELKYLTNDLKTLIEILLISQLPIKNKDLIKEKMFKRNNYAREHPIR